MKITIGVERRGRGGGNYVTAIQVALNGHVYKVLSLAKSLRQTYWIRMSVLVNKYLNALVPTVFISPKMLFTCLFLHLLLFFKRFFIQHLSFLRQIYHLQPLEPVPPNSYKTNLRNNNLRDSIKVCWSHTKLFGMRGVSLGSIYVYVSSYYAGTTLTFLLAITIAFFR